MKAKYILPTVIILITVFLIFRRAYYQYQNNTSALKTFEVSPVVTQSVLGQQTKTTNCIIHGPYPDTNCTPGAVFSTVTKDQICQPGYSKSVRNVSLDEKHQIYDEYGIYSHTAGQYEVDHLISLELGGSNDIANLWPEAAEPKPGYHEKDKVENYLHDQVCKGFISLQTAQQEIVHDWLGVYNNLPAGY